MPSGGARPGAGRKPKAKVLTMVPQVALPQPKEVAKAPVRLNKEVRVVWDRLAPHAHLRGTLSPETAEGFVLLCETYVRQRDVAAAVEKEGYVISSALIVKGRKRIARAKHPLMNTLIELTQRVEMLMGRYGLIGDGNRVRTGKATGDLATANPWEAIAK